MNQTEKRELVIHSSINRPHLILGGDRELIIYVVLICTCLAFATGTIGDVRHPLTILGPLAALVLWTVLLMLVRRMAKADPLMRQVYVRSLRYAKFYPARSGIDAVAAPVPARWER